MTIELCFSSDNNYVQHLTVALASVFHHRSASDELSICVLDGGISESNKSMILAFA